VIAEAVNRAVLVLGAGAIASGGFAFVDAVQYRMVRLGAGSLAVLLVFAVLAIAGARMGRRALVTAAGAGLLAAAVLQLLQLGSGANWLGGDGSTVSFFLGVGVGWLVLGSVRPPIPDLPGDPPARE
jgi:hypothetical protein